MGLLKGFDHHINRKLDAIPVDAKLRRLPVVLRELVSAETRRLEQAGIIEKVDASELTSPVVVVRKKDGSIRLCVDLREANIAIIVDGFHLPHTDDHLHQLAGSTRISQKLVWHQLIINRIYRVKAVT